MLRKPVAIASDHAGFDLKQFLVQELKRLGYGVEDLGCRSTDSVDYPDYADAMARTLAAGAADLGVLICGSGIGVSMAANRHRHVRAALCHDHLTAKLARAHNDANVLVLGGRLTGPAVAADCLETFLATAFEGGRHKRRLDKFSAGETENPAQDAP